ncbi:MAG TPA: substrate-binding domain-containing protein [Pseudonocardiaceae bacterium]
MPRHRAADGPARRGVAKWPIAVLISVLLVGLVWLGWSYASDVLERRAAAELASCTEGEETLTVAVTPSLSEVIERAAMAWTRSHPVVLDHCMRAEVARVPPQAVLTGLTTGWETKALGARPGAWLPESSLWINRLAAQDAKLLGSEPASIATSPVVLAMPEQQAAAIREGNVFTWGQLPKWTNVPEAWQRYGHPEWGAFTVAMPDVASNPASALALQAVLASAGQKGSGPVTVDMLTEQPVTEAMHLLAAATPPEVSASTMDALNALAAATDPTGTPFDAVPTLEYDLYRRNLGLDGSAAPAQPLTGVMVGGPTPTADFPFIAIADERVDQLQVRAAQKFREFLQSGPQQLELAKAGLRVPSTKVRPNPSPGIRWTSTQEDLTAADANTTQQISAAWANAGNSGRVVTVLVDVSRSMLEDGGGGKNRLDWVKGALTGQIGRFGSGSMGLWTFSRNLGDQDEPYRQLAPTGPVLHQRQELENAVAGMQAASATFLYPSLLVVYDSALEHIDPGKQNRVVLITDGPDDSQMTYEHFMRELTKRRAGKPDLPISVIAIGPDADRNELTELARSTGGSFSTIKDATTVETALAQLLGGS